MKFFLTKKQSTHASTANICLHHSNPVHSSPVHSSSSILLCISCIYIYILVPFSLHSTVYHLYHITLHHSLVSPTFSLDDQTSDLTRVSPLAFPTSCNIIYNPCFLLEQAGYHSIMYRNEQKETVISSSQSEKN